MSRTSIEDLSFGGFVRKLEKLRSEISALPAKSRLAAQRDAIYPPQLIRMREEGQSLYPYVRLLLPVADRSSRGMFGLKSQKLASVFYLVLDLSSLSADGKLIKNWKAGGGDDRMASSSTSKARAAPKAIEGDVAGKVFEVLSRRAGMYPVGAAAAGEAPASASESERMRLAAEACGKWTLRDANAWLDSVVQCYRSGMTENERRELDMDGSAGGRGGSSRKRFIADSTYEAVFRKMIDECGPREVRWLAAIILGDMRLSISTRNVLKWFHPDANEALSLNPDLRALFSNEELRDPMRRAKMSIKLGVPFDPLRCNRFEPHKSLAGKDFLIEQKIDGERMVVHFRRAGGLLAQGPGKVTGESAGPDAQLVCYSRNKLPKRGYAKVLRSHLLECIASDVTELVLDGELVGWDQASQSPLPCKFNRGIAIDERKAKKRRSEEPLHDGDGDDGGDDDGGGAEDEDGDASGDSDSDGDSEYGEKTDEKGITRSVLFYAFDCLWLRKDAPVMDPSRHSPLPQGDLTQQTLEKRRIALTAALPFNKPGHLMRLAPLATAINVSTIGATAMIDAALLASHGRNEEGIVIKLLDTPYEFSRSSHWMKFKPEYITGSNDTIDVAVVGGYRNEGSSWRTTMTSAAQERGETLVWVFLCAMPRWSTPERTGRPTSWAPLCVAGSGVKASQAQWLIDRLSSQWTPAPLAPAPMPKWLCGWKPESTVRPDFLVKDPNESIVIELKGSEIFSTTVFFAEARDGATGAARRVTVRFPRVHAFRRDKAPREADSEERLTQIWNDFDRKMMTSEQFRKVQSMKVGGKGRGGRGARLGAAGARGGGSGVGGAGGARGRAVPGAYAVIDSSREAVVANVFDGALVCLLPHSNDEYRAWALAHRLDVGRWGSRRSISTEVARLGGRLVMSVPQGGGGCGAYFFGVGVRGTHLGYAVAGLAPPGTDIFTPTWLADAASAGAKPAQLRAEHVLRASARTERALACLVDSWGDEHAGPRLDTARARALLERALAARAAAQLDAADARAVAAAAAATSTLRNAPPPFLFRSPEAITCSRVPVRALFPGLRGFDATSVGDECVGARAREAWKASIAWRDFGGALASTAADADVIFVDDARDADALRALDSELSSVRAAVDAGTPVVDFDFIRTSFVRGSCPPTLTLLRVPAAETLSGTGASVAIG